MYIFFNKRIVLPKYGKIIIYLKKNLKQISGCCICFNFTVTLIILMFKEVGFEIEKRRSGKIRTAVTQQNAFVRIEIQRIW